MKMKYIFIYLLEWNALLESKSHSYHSKPNLIYIIIKIQSEQNYVIIIY